MGVNVPPELAGIMSMLGPYPGIDEDLMRASGNGDRRAVTAVLPAVEGADTTVRTTRQVYRGDSAAAMNRHWNTVGNEHVPQAVAAMRAAPAIVEGAASVVTATKVATLTQAASALVEMRTLLVTGGATAGAAATAYMLMRRRAVGRILRAGGDGTGKVIAPILSRRVVEPMRHILENVRRPGGPGMSPAFAGAGRRVVPPRMVTPRAPTGPRFDGIAYMGRKNRGSSGGSESGGRRWGSRDDTGKFHGDLPRSTRGMSEKQKKDLADDLRKSIGVRKAEEERLGYEAGHAERIKREESFLNRLQGRG
ncbi:MAG TPA: hypothetical protein VFV66_08690 [Nonomuraea sp.]|nr:hypothetical protein [Nonomuraea sp.]